MQQRCGWQGLWRGRSGDLFEFFHRSASLRFIRDVAHQVCSVVRYFTQGEDCARLVIAGKLSDFIRGRTELWKHKYKNYVSHFHSTKSSE